MTQISVYVYWDCEVVVVTWGEEVTLTVGFVDDFERVEGEEGLGGCVEGCCWRCEGEGEKG